MKEELFRLLEKFAKDGVSEEEHVQFQIWLKNAPEDEIEEALELFPHFIEKTSQKTDLHADLVNTIEKSLDAANYIPSRPVLWRPLRVAAIAILLAGIAGLVLYFSNSRDVSETLLAKKNQESSVVLSSNSRQVTLTLADGRTIILDSAGNGLLASEAGAFVRKTGNEQIIYDASTAESNYSAVAYNTISTPKGKQFQIILPDRTKVWLNAGSTLKFPTVFSVRDRSVELSGEAYFEVASNKEKPFKVYSGNQTVEVLGTHFNVNAYTDEDAILTTLVEGSVKLSRSDGDQSQILKPGQQAKFEKFFKVMEVDTYKAVAWKDGYLNFSHETIPTVMRKIARWYDIDVQYKGSVTKERFVGKIYRFQDISEVLEMLEHTGSVHFKQEGRLITVLP